MADTEKDPKIDDSSEAAPPEETESRAQRSLKNLIRDAGNALGGLMDDPPANESAEPVTWELGSADFIEEASDEKPKSKSKSKKKSKAKAAAAEPEEIAAEAVMEADAVIEPAIEPEEALEASVESEVDPEMAVEEPEIEPGSELEADTAPGAQVEEIEEEREAEAEMDSEAVAQEGLSEEEAALADAELGPAEFIENERVVSIIEALLFASDRPVSVNTIKQIFKGSNVRAKDITRCLDLLASEYARTERGVTLEEVNGGYQLRTKVDNSEFLKRLSKTRPFRLSGPALETLAIMAYKQPLTKHEVDEIRGVESGHLVRALMERGLVCFNGKSELPGKPMLYGTTRKFLETFGLRNLKELPTLSEIDELLPDGIGDEVEEKKPKLADITGDLAQDVKTQSYSEGEEELQKINDSLNQIDTSSEFFEQEKIRQRERRDSERAANIREAMAVGEDVESKDKKWLARYEAKLAADAAAAAGGPIAAEASADADGETIDIGAEAEGEGFRKDIEGLSENLGMNPGDADADEMELAAMSESESEDDLDVMSEEISDDDISDDIDDHESNA